MSGNVLLFGKNGVLFGSQAKTLLMRKYSHTKWSNNISGKFRKFGQKSFATPQICLLLHLWLQSHRPQKLEVELVSLVSLHCHAYGFGLLLYCCRFVQHGERNCEGTFKAIMEVLYCFTVAIGLPGDTIDYIEDKRSAVAVRIQNKVVVE